MEKWITILISILILFSSLTLVSAEIIYEQNNQTSGGAYGVYGVNWRAVTFNVTNGSFDISNVSLYMTRQGNPTNLFYVSIRATDSYGNVTGSDLSTGNISTEPWQADAVWRWREKINMTPYTLINNTKYALVMSHPTADASNYMYIAFGTNDYTKGNYSSSTDSGVTWTLGANDPMFVMWGSAPTPTLTTGLDYPTSGISTTNFNITFNTTLYPISTNLTNATYNIWYSNGSLFNQTTVTLTGNVANTSNYTIHNFNINSYKWNVEGCAVNASASGYVCKSASVNSTFKVGFTENSFTYNSSSYETALESFILNMTVPTGYTPTNGYLNYNGTDYSATITSGGGNDYILSRTIDIPLLIGNKEFYFKWDIDSTTQNSSTYSQTIGNTSLVLCNAGFTVPFLNFTFKNEESGVGLNATIDASTWTYYLGSGAINETYTYSTTTNASSFGFCVSPASRNITLYFSIQYSASGYPQKRYSNYSVYSNMTTNTTLYLLPSADGLYVTYQVVSASEQPIDNVYVVAERQISGEWETVGSGYTGDDGGITFWVNPDYTHRITFVKEGYDTTTQTHTPTQSTYTVYLSSTTETNITNYMRGITYYLSPLDYVLNNLTYYLFNFTITSTYWDLDEFGFILKNGSGYNLGSNSSTVGTGGTVSLNISTGSNSSIVMEYYWLIDGTYSNATKTWGVSDTGDLGFSIKTFFDDLKNYTDQEIFGLNEFSRTLLIFLFIFIIVGTMCFISGIYSPAAVIWEIVVLVTLFDFGLDMLPTPVNAIPHFITFFVFIIAIGITIWEVKS